MTRRKRLVLFWIMAVLFVALSASFVLYSQGWRLDFSTMTARKIGAMYIRSFPSSANISLNGEAVKNESWFLQNGTLVNNLFPRHYEVRLNAPGYKEWKETFVVEPMKVAEIKYAVLIPEKPALSYSSTSVENFWLINKKFVISENERLSWGGIALPKAEFIASSWDGARMLLKEASSGSYLFFDTAAQTTFNASMFAKNTIFKKTAPVTVMDPDNIDQFAAYDATTIAKYTISRGQTLFTERVPERSEVAQVALSRWGTAWGVYSSAKKTTEVRIFSLQNRETSPVVPGKTVSLKWMGGKNTIGVLQDDGNLYLYSVADHTIENIANDVRYFAFSPEEERVATAGPSSIEVISFVYEKDYRRFRLPSQESIEKVQWHQDGQHLFVYATAGVSFLDINDRNTENYPLLTSSRHVFYDGGTNSLYFEKNKEIYSYKFSE